jgi:bacteriorhodopsin
MSSLLHSSLWFSIVVQLVTGVIELLALFVKTAPGMRLIKQLLGLEVAVQAVEGSFYAWLYYNIDRVKNITPKRYADWAITTPTMLVTLIAYIIYLNAASSSDSLSLIQILRENAVPITQILALNWLMLLFGYLGEVGVIPLVAGVALGFVPFVAYFYIMYERFVANDAIHNNNGISLKMYAYFLVAWSLYGIVAVLPYALKNTIYNVLDLFSKNFFGLFLSYLIVSNATG